MAHCNKKTHPEIIQDAFDIFGMKTTDQISPISSKYNSCNIALNSWNVMDVMVAGLPRLVSGIWISFHPDFAKVSVNPEALRPFNTTFTFLPTDAVGTKTANFTAAYPVVLSEGLAFERRKAPKVDV